jgi:8-hydroxy-5-deazaflavin:NADPH oxidoreductase
MQNTISILGTGNVAKAIATLIQQTGAAPVFGSRAPEGVSETLHEIGRVVTHQEAVEAADLIILAMPFSTTGIAALSKLKGLHGKVIVDAMNPLQSDWSPLILGA